MKMHFDELFATEGEMAVAKKHVVLGPFHMMPGSKQGFEVSVNGISIRDLSGRFLEIEKKPDGGYYITQILEKNNFQYLTPKGIAKKIHFDELFEIVDEPNYKVQVKKDVCFNGGVITKSGDLLSFPVRSNGATYYIGMLKDKELNVKIDTDGMHYLLNVE